jgi:hypothetical protein
MCITVASFFTEKIFHWVEREGDPGNGGAVGYTGFHATDSIASKYPSSFKARTLVFSLSNPHSCLLVSETLASNIGAWVSFSGKAL